MQQKTQRPVQFEITAALISISPPSLFISAHQIDSGKVIPNALAGPPAELSCTRPRDAQRQNSAARMQQVKCCCLRVRCNVMLGGILDVQHTLGPKLVARLTPLSNTHHSIGT